MCTELQYTKNYKDLIYSILCNESFIKSDNILHHMIPVFFIFFFIKSRISNVRLIKVS